MKSLIKILFLCLFISCESDIQLQSSDDNNSSSSSSGTSSGTSSLTFSIDNIITSGIKENGFSIVLGYVKDSGTYSATLYYCNETDSPGCDPLAGTSQSLTVTDNFFYNTISNLSSPNDGGDTLNLLVQVSDGGSVVASDTTTVTLLEEPSMTLSITNNLDDGETAQDSPNFYDADGEGGEQVYIGRWSGGGALQMWSFLRFQLSKSIPDGATIKSAILRVRGDGTFNWDTSNYYLMVYGESSSNAPRVTDFEDTIDIGTNGNTSVSSNVRWPNSGGLEWYSGVNVSPNLASIIQDLVDNNNGLNQNDYIQLWLTTPSFGVAAQVIYADYGHPNHFTELEIIWSY